jgi:hypothetical protein
MTASQKVDWEEAADAICSRMLTNADGVLRKASEAVYENMLYDLQAYLRENVDFNLKSELERARSQEAEAKAATAAAREVLSQCQKALAMMVSPNAIAQTTVINAFQQAVAAETAARRFLHPAS